MYKIVVDIFHMAVYDAQLLVDDCNLCCQNVQDIPHGLAQTVELYFGSKHVSDTLNMGDIVSVDNFDDCVFYVGLPFFHYLSHCGCYITIELENINKATPSSGISQCDSCPVNGSSKLFGCVNVPCKCPNRTTIQ